MEFIACAVLAVVTVIFSFDTAHTKAFDPLSRPLVAVLPHQDDELFMAGFIKRAVDSGRTVYMVMVTDGGSSAVRDMINGKDVRGNPVADLLTGAVRDPVAEGYAPLARTDFVAARNKEFLDSAMALGVKKQHVLFMNPGGVSGTLRPLYRDGKLTTKQAKQVFAALRKRLGDGTYATVAHGHSDHVALQEGLHETRGITEKVFFPLLPDETMISIVLTEEERAAKARSLAIYSTWDPGQGYYAIALHSVPDMLREWRDGTEEYYFTE